MALNLVNICDMSYFSSRLRNLIEERGLSSQNLALDLRIDPAVMSKVLNGRMKPPTKFVEALCTSKELGLTLSVLKGWQAIDQFGEDAIFSAVEALKEG